MDNIIGFTNYKWRKNYMDERLNKLVIELKQLKKDNYTFSMDEIDKIALKILSNLNYVPYNIATPIVKIVKQFGFKAYNEEINDPNLSGDIYINGDTERIYGHEKVIIVNDKDEITHQRFVVAHELAHYLFDFLGDSKYENNKSIKFNAAYYKDRHDTPTEKRANRFAASLLMLESLFIKQYNIAKSIDDNSLFILMYLSRFFETSISSIQKRIIEVLITEINTYE